MKPMTRFLLCSMVVFSFFAPSRTEAGVIPWVYDAIFGPVGSQRAYWSGAYYGGPSGAYYGGGMYNGMMGGGCCGTPAYYGSGCSTCGVSSASYGAAPYCQDCEVADGPCGVNYSSGRIQPKAEKIPKRNEKNNTKTGGSKGTENKTYDENGFNPRTNQPAPTTNGPVEGDGTEEPEETDSTSAHRLNIDSKLTWNPSGPATRHTVRAKYTSVRVARHIQKTREATPAQLARKK